MSRFVLGATVVLAAGLVFLGWRAERLSTSEEVFQGRTKPTEPAPLCPWREPEKDLKELFPKATRYEVETRILSGLRTELTHRLGRAPTGDENALRLYRVYNGTTVLGTVLTRRAKGEYGAIELVLATDANGRVSGVRLQRLREPEPIARVLEDPSWQLSLQGKDAESSWQLGQDVPQVPPEAQASARALLDGARSLLILLATAENHGAHRLTAEHHH
jgi:hypothetical protein